jgi:hypothetical protein
LWYRACISPQLERKSEKKLGFTAALCTHYALSLSIWYIKIYRIAYLGIAGYIFKFRHFKVVENSENKQNNV